MTNKPKNEPKVTKSLPLSLAGFAFALLIGLVAASLVWAMRRNNELPIQTIWSNVFVTSGVFMLIFACFWGMSRRGYGNNIKFYFYRRRNRRTAKYGGKTPENAPRSPLEYEKINIQGQNHVKIGLYLTFAVGAAALLAGIITAVV